MSSPSPIGSPFIELLSVESTNNYAMGLVHEAMAQHGTAVFALEQTRGKGQRNRQWASEAGKNIALSIVIQPQPSEVSAPFLLSMAMAVGACTFLAAHAGSEARIKWPNDIYWRDRKAAGILIENLWQGGSWKFAVAGIGVNINQTEFDGLANAVSLKQITGKELPPLELAKELCTELQRAYERLLSDPAAIEEAYHALLYKRNETVKFRRANRLFEARICHVTRDGQLVVQHAIEERFAVGDIEWIPSFS